MCGVCVCGACVCGVGVCVWCLCVWCWCVCGVCVCGVCVYGVCVCGVSVCVDVAWCVVVKVVVVADSNKGIKKKIRRGQVFSFVVSETQTHS